MQELTLTLVGRYGDSNILLTYCKELDKLVQVEEITDIDNPDAILVGGYVVKIRENQFSIIFGLNKKSA